MFVGKKIEVQLFGGTIPPHRVPPGPLSVTPPNGSLSGVRIRKLAFRKLFWVERISLYILVYIPTIILIFGALKTDNSLTLKQSVFLTCPSIRIYGLVD